MGVTNLKKTVPIPFQLSPLPNLGAELPVKVGLDSAGFSLEEIGKFELDLETLSHPSRYPQNF